MLRKKSMFTLKQRKSWILDTFAHEKKIAVERYTGLTVDFCKQKNISFIIRGIRNQQDFEYERSIAQMNRQLMPNVENHFLIYRTGICCDKFINCKGYYQEWWKRRKIYSKGCSYIIGI